MIAKNNPLNIRYNKNTKWLGQIGQHKGFVVFDTMEHGYRAALWLIRRTYMSRYRLNTIRDIISRFAPSCENDTESYIDFIVCRLNFQPDDILSFYDIPPLVSCMAWIETHSSVLSSDLYRIMLKYKI